jgi:hypothetical protein
MSGPTLPSAVSFGSYDFAQQAVQEVIFSCNPGKEKRTTMHNVSLVGSPSCGPRRPRRPQPLYRTLVSARRKNDVFFTNKVVLKLGVSQVSGYGHFVFPRKMHHKEALDTNVCSPSWQRLGLLLP